MAWNADRVESWAQEEPMFNKEKHNMADYELYRQWLKGLNNQDLNKELRMVAQRKKAAPRGSLAERAWGTMHTLALAVQWQRDA